MSHFNPTSTKFAFRHRRRKRSRFLPSHDTRTRTRTRTHTHTRALIKACGRHLLVIHNAGTYTLLHVVSYVFSPLERRFTFTPILHQPLTFVRPFYNPQRRYLYFVTRRLLRVLPVGATVHLTPILHQPLTFVLPFYNPQRRVFSKNKISLRFINNPGSDFVSRYRNAFANR